MKFTWEDRIETDTETFNKRLLVDVDGTKIPVEVELEAYQDNQCDPCKRVAEARIKEYHAQRKTLPSKVVIGNRHFKIPDPKGG